MSSTKSSSLDITLSKSISFESLDNEEQTVYQDLSILSTNICKLDKMYYEDTNGSDGPTISSMEISNNKYNALAQHELNLCTAYPHLLQILEEGSGLGKRATRFGDQVG